MRVAVLISPALYFLIQQQHITHSAQNHIEHLPRQITCWAIKHTLTNLEEIIPCLFSDCNRNTLETNKIAGKSPNMWRLNNILLNKIRLKGEILREIKKYFELNTNENTTYQNL